MRQAFGTALLFQPRASALLGILSVVADWVLISPLGLVAVSCRARAAPREGVLYVREQEGQEWAAAATAYCKVYCKDFHGAERFYKDGYTDLLGRFDYASLSGPPGSTGIMEMAALVVSKHGCVIMRIDPPPGLS
mmetsp:Transcript_26086/g.73048  ORF Transcript_26086/g.73048 Transcript_26086/m.73048 type:complete len:135 (-) Transcript_26086:372-776(-)